MKLLLVLTLFFHSLLSWSEADRSRYEILPSDPTTSTITEDLFHTVINRVESLYSSEFAAQGILVDFNADWNVSYFSAWAHDDNPLLYSLNFWGGMARIPGLNEYGWAFIVCHEVGHLLGGTPMNSLELYAWGSAEGQADYFAGAHCLKRYFTSFPHQGEEIKLSHKIENQCNENKYCLNSAKAAISFSHVIKYLYRDTPNLSLETPSKVNPNGSILKSYPDAQCRLDTIFESGKCINDFSSLEQWVCENSVGSRPACWFKN
ncbi:hypothetical protein [Halobacteriovorax sp. JY17]|uniref:ImmA/IrrE family metallo-endopeptidase n=1 Tax=Halobacteriovorax sp. JY17 TaxID=2014617 RepID=UPI000C3677A4|nr:hypothetical protein [Halobacteriovorax sp. JY17]PIK14623.1 MAG: hypothetical protein CES88_09805 [Halobacteriovorax sp. JY17]